MVGNRDELRRLSWLPAALWVAVPGWGWMYSNNMLENTLGMFAVLAVYAVLRATSRRREQLTPTRSPGELSSPTTHGSTELAEVRSPLTDFAWLIVAAAAIAAAVLSKGPVGLYPLATPMVAYVALRRQTLLRAVVESIALVALFCGIMGLVYNLPGASEYFDKYLHGQVFAAMQGRREVVNSILGRFDILWKVVQQVILPLAIAVGLIWTARRNGWIAGATMKQGHGAQIECGTPTLPPAIAFCLLTGISASAPIVASLKQSGHYAFPSYAFYALGLALWCAPAVNYLSTAASPATLMRRHRMLRYLSAATLLLLFVASCLLVNHPHGMARRIATR